MGFLREHSRTLLYAVVAFVLFVVPVLFTFYGDLLWFSALGYRSVFVRVLAYRAALFAAFGAATFVILYGSYRWASRNIAGVIDEYDRNRWPTYIIAGIALFLGISYSHGWKIVLRFLHRTAFASSDPVFGMNAAFYVFEIPFYQLVLQFLLAMLVVSLLVALVVYAMYFGYKEYDEFMELVMGQGQVQRESFSVGRYVQQVREHAYPQIAVLVGGILLALGGMLWLARYTLLTSPSPGAVYGIGYTDMHVTLPLLSVMTGIAVIGGAACLANAWLQRRRVLSVAFVLLITVGLLGQVGGFLTQSYVVEPDEFNKEKQFIGNEINYTRKGFALDRIDERNFKVSPILTRQQLSNNTGTIQNIRLWDWRPLLKTYNELQIFRSYYTFRDVDVDRYDINGSEREVMVSAREIDLSALPRETRSWVNEHLVYTHGFGITMSPVSKVSSEGLPKLYVKDIPPKSSINLSLDQPRIYYGEGTGTYAIVNTETKELDYPSGDRNVYNMYDGSGGVQLSSTLREVVYSGMFGDPQIFFSGSITRDSRIMLHRNIRERVNQLAPFLEYDDDPYVVAANGQLYWILDAYTTSDKFPYARPLRMDGEQVNYIRNSVKVVVNAYTGETTFYVAKQEPLVNAYRSMFPSLFEPLSSMPTAIRDHIRYPEDIFQAQAEMYRTYHMESPRVFYNKEDIWRVPNEVTRGREVPMEPYYIMMKLPGENETEFIQILPFVPRGKQNMIGWMAARSDPPHYGEIKAFQFSKQELIYGPMQVESRISQDTEISQRITLWSQAGSSVFRGNLLAIPIANTIIYVEPLFLQSTGEGSLPQLKRVIVAHNDRLTMQPTLDKALDVLFGDATGKQPEGVPPDQPVIDRTLLQRALNLYTEATSALRSGNFSTYGAKIGELGTVLRQLEQQGPDGSGAGEPSGDGSSDG